MNAPSRARAGEPSRVLARGSGYLFTGHRNVMIASWTAQGTRPLIDALARTLAAFVADHPEGVSNVHIIAAGLPLANTEAREALSALMKLHAGDLACAGTVLDGTGFWASATRGVIMSLQLIAPSTFSMRTCATDAELVAWMPKLHAQRTGVVLPPEELERAIADARVLSATPA